MSDKLKVYKMDVEKSQTTRMKITIADLLHMTGAPDNASVSIRGEMLKSTDKIEVVFTSAESFELVGPQEEQTLDNRHMNNHGTW